MLCNYLMANHSYYTFGKAINVYKFYSSDADGDRVRGRCEGIRGDPGGGRDTIWLGPG